MAIDNNLKRDMGLRLRQVRKIFNEGGKLSAEQFAFIFGETTDKILNYELGRASIPLSLLVDLYYRGFNPIYILTGKESIFAKNSEGRKREKQLATRNIVSPSAGKDEVININKIDATDESKIPIISVAAGKIE